MKEAKLKSDLLIFKNRTLKELNLRRKAKLMEMMEMRKMGGKALTTGAVLLGPFTFLLVPSLFVVASLDCFF